MTGRTVELEAPGKINLFLRVLGRRDDGYHDLESLVLPISLSDRIRVHAHADPTRFRTLSLELEVTGEPGVTAGVPIDETNLALRAAAALAERTGARGFAEITVHKRVPHAAGMGGGSADAAAVLRALDDLWACGLSASELRELAAELGSDVPALLAGGPVLVRGRGELVEPVAVPAFRWAVLPLPLRVSTRDAFRWWDEDGPAGSTALDPGEVTAAAASGDPPSLAPLLANDLQGPVERRHPKIGEARRRLVAAGALAAVVTGSGPTVVGLLDDDRPFELDGAIEVTSAGRAPASRTTRR
jgi:4-diphosphocytidyl-2-C-methyl-D-erythritol kinase